MASQKSWVFRRGLLWTAELATRRPNPPSTRIPVSISQLQEDATPGLISTVAQMDPISSEAIVRRLALGRQCYAAWDQKSVVAYGWLTRGPEWVGEFERHLNVSAGEAYIWDCATLPTYRRQRLFSALIAHIADHLRQQGLQRLWIMGVRVAPSLARSVVAAGFTPVLHLTYIRLLNRRFLLTAPASGASPAQLDLARRLLTPQTERRVGPLIIGNSSRPQPPDTHIDR